MDQFSLFSGFVKLENMRIVVNKSELDSLKTEGANGKITIDASLSVNQLKSHYFETLSKIGELISVDASVSDEELANLCSEADVVYAYFHEEPRENVKCRLLQHTLGSLMLMGGFKCRWTYRDSTMNIVTTKKQLDQLKKGLQDAAPHLGVFTPGLNSKAFFMPDGQQIRKEKINKNSPNDEFNIIYAGRFIANKGICQLIRALNIWPIANARLTLIGDIEPNFHISQSNTLHVTFNRFLRSEVIEKNKKLKLIIKPTLQQEFLREIYWSSDCFVYPTFHEDENFGMAPREAILCGVPFVVTDFCGLGQLSEAKGGIIKTYPTLGGVRFSIKNLRDELNKIRLWSKGQIIENKLFNEKFVKEECCEKKAYLSLKNSIEELLQIPIDQKPVGKWNSTERIDRWAKLGPDSFKNAISLAKTEHPDGLYVDGTGYASDGWYSEPYFMQAIQALYTTCNSPPSVIKGKCYRGFWRIALWSEEKALVEFGFPGPRVMRYNQKQWASLLESVATLSNGEVEFYPKNTNTIEIIQKLVDFGYLVPDEL